MYLNIDSGKLRDVVAFGRATIDLYANEIGAHGGRGHFP